MSKMFRAIFFPSKRSFSKNVELVGSESLARLASPEMHFLTRHHNLQPDEKTGLVLIEPEMVKTFVLGEEKTALEYKTAFVLSSTDA